MTSKNIKSSDKACTRIFRPWDNVDSSQDTTVSTTTNDEGTSQYVEQIPAQKTAFKPIENSPVETKIQLPPPPVPIIYPMDPYQEIIQASLPHPYPGIVPTDPFLMQSMQGIAFEEYAQVLNQEHQAKILASRKQRPKKYKCPHCDVGFSNNGQLKGHIRIHTGERPFKCDEKDCGKSFTRNEELTRHKRIHSGLRPFPCTHCGKRFGRKDHLKKHSRTHFQPRGMYAVPVMMPLEAWAASSSSFPFVPMFGY